MTSIELDVAVFMFVRCPVMHQPNILWSPSTDHRSTEWGQFTVLFALVAAASASAAAVAERELTRDEIIAMRATYGGLGTRALDSLDDRSLDEQSLESRACPKSNCDCVGVKGGLFCGDGYFNCKKGYVYQCSGGSKSCVFGKRDSCKKCNKLKC
ncbi:hypothetical protein CspHIS471_0406230 [Cutaneotrichosporon sp. HIS471]|nr:hypothetical protein CspHIS471_0406230 [Cutaneotrichosporon sp. HIS471]